jgi:polar amino acid transport system substrate-binding protein
MLVPNSPLVRVTRRAFAQSLAIGALLPLGALAQGADLSPEQPGRIRSQKIDKAIALISKDFRFVEEGAFTVATTLGRLPLGAFAADAKTPIGSEPDIAQLVADSLGLKLALVPVAWPDWPLGLVSGKFDAVISNVTVTEARKEKFDFSTYRKDTLGVYVKSDSSIKQVHEPKDVAGLRVIVDAGTNQEQILLHWSKLNVEAGLAPIEPQYYDDSAVARLALQSGRADAYFGPNALAAYEAIDGKTRLVGVFSGGWPLTAEIAVTTRRGSGLADAVTAAINAQIANGNYKKLLDRWNLGSEAIAESRTDPPGLPKS